MVIINVSFFLSFERILISQENFDLFSLASAGTLLGREEDSSSLNFRSGHRGYIL